MVVRPHWLAVAAAFGCSLNIDLDEPVDDAQPPLDAAALAMDLGRAADPDGALVADAADAAPATPDVEMVADPDAAAQTPDAADLADVPMMRLVDARLPDAGADAAGCVDRDGDGFGAGCDPGADCDDDDVNRWMLDTGFPDVDGDGFTGPAEQVCAGAELPAPFRGAPSAEADCDDRDEQVWRELRLGEDRDADGWTVNEAQHCIGAEIPAGFARPNDANDCDDGRAEVHPFANERCDGRDTDCEGGPSVWEVIDGGALRCRRAVWIRASRLGQEAADPRSNQEHGAAEARRLLEQHVDQIAHRRLSGLDLGEVFGGFGIIVLSGAGSGEALTRVASQALFEWVQSGGRLLFVSHRSGEASRALVQSLPNGLGLLAAEEGGGSWSGDVDPLLDLHPLMQGVERMRALEADRLVVGDPAIVLAEGVSPFAIASEPGLGRFVAFADESFLTNDDSSNADISHGDHERLVQNVWAWLNFDRW